jgi:hypothetical protein
MAEITVNGRTYELVPLNEVTLDEAIVVWEYSKLSLDQIADLDGFHPGVVAALIHIAVARAETGETARTIRKTVGQIKVAELESIFTDISQEVEELPPPSEPDASSPNAGSGGTSPPTSAPAPELSLPNGSGSPGSDTGATLPPRISAL